jgi:hypothetical protein
VLEQYINWENQRGGTKWARCLLEVVHSVQARTASVNAVVCLHLF